MREILFKAKRLDNGEWVEGFPFPSIPGEELNRMALKATRKNYRICPKI